MWTVRGGPLQGRRGLSSGSELAWDLEFELITPTTMRNKHWGQVRMRTGGVRRGWSGGREY